MTIGLLATLVLFPLAGFALARVAGPMQPFLAGAGAVGAILFVTNAAGVPLVPMLVALVVASVVVLVVVRAPRREFIRYPLLPTLIAAVIAAALLAIAATVPLDDYDGRAFWLLKAKAIAVDRSVNGAFFHQHESFDPRNQYPLVVPIDAAVVMLAAHDLDDREVRWLYVFFAIGFALELRRRTGPWSAAVFLALPGIATQSLTAGSDILLGAVTACAFFELVDAVSPLRLGLWLSFIALTKSEGLPLSLLLLVLRAFIFRKRIAVAAAPLFVAIATLLVWRSSVPRSDEPPFAHLIATIPQHAREFAHYLGGFATEMLAFANWGVLWMAVGVALIVLVSRRMWLPAAGVRAVGVFLPGGVGHIQ